MPDPPAQPRKHRRRLRLSLRGLMALVLILSGGLGWVVHRANLQRDAVAAILRTGGSVRYDWEMIPSGGINPQGKPKAPKRLVDFLGPDYFGHVALVQLGEKTTDADMVHVGRLRRLVGFSAHGTNINITDAGAAHLAGMTGLEHITLDDTRVTGAGLAILEGMSKLKYLHLRGLPIHDADLAHVAPLKSLWQLHLARAPITDAGLVHLRGLIDLRAITLDDVGITSEGLKHLPGFPLLNRIHLSGTKITDLATLPPLPKLRSILLEGTPITDAGLIPVAGMKALDSLSLSDTSITDDALAYLPPQIGTLLLDGTRITDERVEGAGKLSRPPRPLPIKDQGHRPGADRPRFAPETRDDVSGRDGDHRRRGTDLEQVPPVGTTRFVEHRRHRRGDRPLAWFDHPELPDRQGDQGHGGEPGSAPPSPPSDQDRMT